MNIELLSTRYRVRPIKTADIPEVLELCKGNPLYYKYCPPAVSIESIQKDLEVLPPGKTPVDKYYLGFYNNESLVAVMDIVFGYPNTETVCIGFFMMERLMQGKGVGTSIITEACQYFKMMGYSFARLGYIKNNSQSKAFWIKNYFEKTGIEVQTEDRVIVTMQRTL
ncbi:MAG: GNAT family N-acetyltransferase [Clostridiales bacterium]|nr:GNAT family N-acetyltransferase [Clostridiales bacterium]